MPTTRFTCNICGRKNQSLILSDDRERPDCSNCKSSIRLRSIVLQLARTLFGAPLPLCDFPKLKTVRGLGITDPDLYASELAERFTYTNTFYDREPRLDLTSPAASTHGQYDFIICSEVMEHVEAPVSRAFESLARMLKPTGALIFSTPFSLDEKTVEHFDGASSLSLTAVEGKPVAVGRSPQGEYVVYDQLTFHGGPGSTLEMRLFSETDLRAQLSAAGFSHLAIDYTGSREFGVEYTIPCSLPIIARLAPPIAPPPHLIEMIERHAELRRIMRATKRSRWVRLARIFGIGPKLPD